MQIKTLISDQAQSLANQVFDPNDQKWKDGLVDKALPVMVVPMLKAMKAAMVEAGVNPTKGMKYNPFHGPDGRFSSGTGSGAHLTPDTGGGSGGGGESKRSNRADATYDADSKKWKLADGSSLPSHIPRIPPAWTGVKISTNPKSSVLATGKDKKGRTQSIYSDTHKAKAAEKKFARISELRSKSKAIRSEIDNDTKIPSTKEHASCLRLIQSTGLRPGSTAKTGAEKQAYGATTLEGRHIKVSSSGEVRLQFTGKKGVSLDIPVTDKTVSADLIQRKTKVGNTGKVFNTDNTSLLKYTKTKDGGGFKSKDFRTAKGTSTAAEMVKSMPHPTTMKDYKKAVKSVATKVSKTLGNTPTIALQSYINPSVFSSWKTAL